MSLEAIDIAGFVLGVITFLLGLGLKQLIANRLPPARVKNIQEAIVEARTHVGRLVASNRILETEAMGVLSSIGALDNELQGLCVDVDNWRPMGWGRRVPSGPTLKELLRQCNSLRTRVAAVRSQLRCREHHQASPTVDCASGARYTPPLSTADTSSAVSVSSIETYELPTVSSSSSSTDPHPVCSCRAAYWRLVVGSGLDVDTLQGRFGNSGLTRRRPYLCTPPHTPLLPPPQKAALQSPRPLPEPISPLPSEFPSDPYSYYLLGQLEHFLSPQNLVANLCLRQQMDSSGWIPITFLASFDNIVRTLTMNPQHVEHVLAFSSLAEVTKGHVRAHLWQPFVLSTAPKSSIELDNNPPAGQVSAEFTTPADSGSKAPRGGCQAVNETHDSDVEEDVKFIPPVSIPNAETPSITGSGTTGSGAVMGTLPQGCEPERMAAEDGTRDEAGDGAKADTG